MALQSSSTPSSTTVPTAERSNNIHVTASQPSTTLNTTSTSAAQESASVSIPFADRIRSAEHRFTSLTQNIAHFSPLKTQLDKHNLAIERLESEVKKKTALLQSCQEKLKASSKRSQSSRQGSHTSLHTSEDTAIEALAHQQAAKEAVDSLNGQLLAAKILHIGLTRQVAQYFESRSELQKLLEEIFSGTTPEHPSEDSLERELEQISEEIVQVKKDFENHRSAKNEFKEVRRYVDIWNDAVEKQIASNAKDVTKSLKKFVPFLGPKPPSYTRIADTHMTNARVFVPTLEDIGLLSDIKMDTVADTSSGLIIYTAKFKDTYNSLSHTLEVLHKKSRVLKKKRNQVIEKLFDERCRIFSDELQAHYRSIGEQLANGGDPDGGSGSGSTDVENMSIVAIGNGNGNMVPNYRQHVESNLMEAYSTAGSSTLGFNSQELLLETEELPSYFQYEATGVSLHHHHHNHDHQYHRRTGSLGSPARSSSASSSLSLSSPLPIAMTDSPPDYVRTELVSGQQPLGNISVAVAAGGGSSSSGGGGGGADEDDDALFRAYQQRYDSHRRQGSDAQSAAGTTRVSLTALMDTPPGYDETRYHTVVDPV